MVRSDARENRARILAAAREAFSQDGAASMNQIAQRAGVGAGTLYRNFPTREALALAVYQDEVAQIIQAAPTLLTLLPPLDALREWTIGLVKAMRRKHGLGEALSPRAHQQINEQTYGPVITAIDGLLTAGKDEGSIRQDAAASDFLQLTGALWRTPTGPNDRSLPMLELILDGLRAPSR